jgi:predicted amidohydrolase
MTTARLARAASASKTPVSSSEHTVAESLEYLCPGSSSGDNLPSWPPDVFALTSLILLRTGAYRHVTSKQWPPMKKWEARIDLIGLAWRDNWNRGKPAPRDVLSLWKTVLRHKDTRLDSVCDKAELCVALIQLCATSDAASFGIGLPTPPGKGYDRFFEHAGLLLIEGMSQLEGKAGSTLCESVHTTRVRVLPKMHTPQTGLTVRSFSHHLALCRTDEMQADWFNMPGNYQPDRLTVLLVPWPYAMGTGQFVRSREKIGSSGKFGFFEFYPRGGRNEAAATLERLFQKAEKQGLAINGVIFPELALTFEQYRAVSDVALARRSFLIAGVAMPPGEGVLARNKVYFAIPIPGREAFVSVSQAKHHRWRLDGWQIKRYGLQNILSPRKWWWEHIAVEERRLAIIATTSWLTISALVCEDLARSEPAGEMLRAVGPNLVVCLLLDGPQLPDRWSARYAMALADDPGSSVLTLTSLGMAQLGKNPSRAVALWKDGQSGGVQEISLPSNREAAVLEIDLEKVEEFTADERSDGGAAGIPRLRKNGLHFI